MHEGRARAPRMGPLELPLEKRHNGVMKRVRITELRDHLSRYLDHVRAGGKVIVLDRNRPVTEIVPVGSTPTGPGIDEGRLAGLERDGIVSRGSGRIPDEILQPTALGKGAKVLAALLEERESGR